MFPLLDSFPHIYNISLNGSRSVAVHASLSTSTGIGGRLKNIADVVQRTRGFEEREALLNSLGEIHEAYDEGWKSSDEEDDY